MNPCPGHSERVVQIIVAALCAGEEAEGGESSQLGWPETPQDVPLHRIASGASQVGSESAGIATPGRCMPGDGAPAPNMHANSASVSCLAGLSCLSCEPLNPVVFGRDAIMRSKLPTPAPLLLLQAGQMSAGAEDRMRGWLDRAANRMSEIGALLAEDVLPQPPPALPPPGMSGSAAARYTATTASPARASQSSAASAAAPPAGLGAADVGPQRSPGRSPDDAGGGGDAYSSPRQPAAQGADSYNSPRQQGLAVGRSPRRPLLSPAGSAAAGSSWLLQQSPSRPGSRVSATSRQSAASIAATPTRLAAEDAATPLPPAPPPASLVGRGSDAGAAPAAAPREAAAAGGGVVAGLGSETTGGAVSSAFELVAHAVEHGDDTKPEENDGDEDEERGDDEEGDGEDNGDSAQLLRQVRLCEV